MPRTSARTSSSTRCRSRAKASGSSRRSGLSSSGRWWPFTRSSFATSRRKSSKRSSSSTPRARPRSLCAAVGSFSSRRAIAGPAERCSRFVRGSGLRHWHGSLRRRPSSSGRCSRSRRPSHRPDSLRDPCGKRARGSSPRAWPGMRSRTAGSPVAPTSQTTRRRPRACRLSAHIAHRSSGSRARTRRRRRNGPVDCWRSPSAGACSCPTRPTSTHSDCLRRTTGAGAPRYAGGVGAAAAHRQGRSAHRACAGGPSLAPLAVMPRGR